MDEQEATEIYAPFFICICTMSEVSKPYSRKKVHQCFEKYQIAVIFMTKKELGSLTPDRIHISNSDILKKKLSLFQPAKIYGQFSSSDEKLQMSMK